MAIDFIDFVIYATGFLKGGMILYNMANSYKTINQIKKLQTIEEKDLSQYKNQTYSNSESNTQYSKVILKDVKYFPFSEGGNIQKLIPTKLQLGYVMKTLDSGEVGYIKPVGFGNKVRLEIQNTAMKADIMTQKIHISRQNYFEIKKFLTLTVIGKIGYDFSSNENIIIAQIIGKNINQIIDSYWTEIKLSGFGFVVLLFIMKLVFSIKQQAVQQARNQMRNPNLGFRIQ